MNNKTNVLSGKYKNINYTDLEVIMMSLYASATANEVKDRVGEYDLDIKITRKVKSASK